MGLSLLGPAGSGTLSLRATLEIGPGDTVVALALIFALSYRYLLDPLDLESSHKRQLQSMLVAVTIPLFLTFVGVMIFASFEII